MNARKRSTAERRYARCVEQMLAIERAAEAGEIGLADETRAAATYMRLQTSALVSLAEAIANTPGTIPTRRARALAELVMLEVEPGLRGRTGRQAFALWAAPRR